MLRAWLASSMRALRLGIYQAFKKSSLDDAACFVDTLRWKPISTPRACARDDIDGICKLDFVDHQESCSAVIRNSAAVCGAFAGQQHWHTMSPDLPVQRDEEEDHD